MKNFQVISMAVSLAALLVVTAYARPNPVRSSSQVCLENHKYEYII